MAYVSLDLLIVITIVHTKASSCCGVWAKVNLLAFADEVVLIAEILEGVTTLTREFV